MFEFNVWDNKEIYQKYPKVNSAVLNYFMSESDISTRGRDIDFDIKPKQYDDLDEWLAEEFAITPEIFYDSYHYFEELLENAKFYTSDTGEVVIELSDEPVLNRIDNPELDEITWMNLVDDSLVEFEDLTGVTAYTLGRSGRHVCVDFNIENLIGFDDLKDIVEKLQKQLIDDANNANLDESFGYDTSVDDSTMYEINAKFNDDVDFDTKIVDRDELYSFVTKIAEINDDDEPENDIDAIITFLSDYDIYISQPKNEKSKEITLESVFNEPDEVIIFKREVNSADDKEEIQSLIYELSDGVAEYDCQAAFDEFEESSLDTLKDKVISAIDLYLEDNDWLDYSDWVELASKSVEDSNGFITDYTLYTNGEMYVCIFGDKELYTPDTDDADFETENEQDAWDWFNSYNGFADDDDLDGILESTEAIKEGIDGTLNKLGGPETFRSELMATIEAYPGIEDDIEELADMMYGSYKGVISIEELESAIEYMIDDALESTEAVNSSYSPDLLNDLVNYYSSFDTMSSEEIWDEIVARYNNEYLANDVIESLDGYVEDFDFADEEDGLFENSVYGSSYIPDIDDSILKHSDEFKYQLLSRMQTDCNYFLGAGNRAEKFLWAGNAPEQIAYMRAIYNSFPDNKKPEWISLTDIDEYEKKMLKLDESLDIDDELDHPEQEFDSAKTSINSNKLPAVYRMISFPAGSIGVDFGGGSFDNAVEYISDLGATLFVYDPYNRSAEHNRQVIKMLKDNGGADWAVNSNVLNVIKEPEARKAVLKNISKITKPNAPIYITVYEGRGDSKEGPTRSGYQLNRKTQDYLEEIREVFPDAKRKGKLITAHNTKSSTSSINENSDNTSSDGYVYTYCDNCGKKNRVKVHFKDYSSPFDDTEFECKYCKGHNLLHDPHLYDDSGEIYGVETNESFDTGKGPYWYFTRHGVQPGSVPKDINILDIVDADNGSYFLSDKVIDTDNLHKYEIEEKKPDFLESNQKSNNLTHNKLVKLKNKILSVVKDVMMSPNFGFEEDEIDEYSVVEVTEKDGRIKAEVRAELDYDGLMELTSVLNPIVKKYNKDSYFEPVEPGIIEAYI